MSAAISVGGRDQFAAEKADGLRPFHVARRARQTALGGPATVSIHDDCDVHPS
jgi:hypothetical protein